jgi:hypothetical protein
MLATTTIHIGGLFLAEIIIIEHLLSGWIGMTIWKNKGGDSNRGFVLCLIFGVLGVFILALAKPRRGEASQRPL